MHAEMQKRIGIARFRKIIALARGLGLLENRVIFGMSQEYLHNQFFHAFKRATFSMRAPGAKKYLTCLPAVLAGQHRQATAAALNRPSTTEYWNR